MAIDINPGTALRQVASFNSSGNFTPPAGTNIVFVSVHGASGGGAGGTFTNMLPQGRTQDGGAALIASAFVQVIPSVAVPVVIGAGGAGGAASTNVVQYGVGGSSAGNTSFDGNAITVTGGAGGSASLSMANTTAATAGSASGTTSLSTVSPSGALTRTGTISTQNTGAHAASPGGQVNSRYSGQNAGTAGSPGQINIYS